jgi:hypothetical protein
VGQLRRTEGSLPSSAECQINRTNLSVEEAGSQGVGPQNERVGVKRHILQADQSGLFSTKDV